MAKPATAVAQVLDWVAVPRKARLTSWKLPSLQLWPAGLAGVEQIPLVPMHAPAV